MGARVDFHTGVGDVPAFACRLLRKAYLAGARVLVRGPTPLLQRVDRELWTFAEREFVPHLRFSAHGPRPPGAAFTPIWLVEGAVPAEPPPVLVSLGGERPDALGPFERIIEVVGLDADDEQRARARWRHYVQSGLSVTHHPARGASAAARHTPG